MSLTLQPEDFIKNSEKPPNLTSFFMTQFLLLGDVGEVD